MPLKLASPNSENVLVKEVDFLRSSIAQQASGIVTRFDTYQRSEGSANGYTQNDIVRFRIPSLLSDMSDATVQYTCNVTPGTGGSFTRISNGCPVFRRLRVLLASTIILDVVDQNLLKEMILMGKPEQYRTSTGKVLQGYGTPAERDAFALDANKVYAFHLATYHDLFKRVMPLHLINDEFTVELTIDKNESILESDRTNPNIELNNLELHYSILNPTKQYNDLLRAKINSDGGLNIVFKSHAQYTNTQLVTGSDRVEAQLPFRYLNVTSINYVCRDQAIVDNLASLNKFETYLNGDNLNYNRIRLDSNYYPQDQCRSVTDLYTQFLEAYNLSYCSDTYAGLEWENSRTMFCQTLAQHPRSIDDDGLVQGQNCARGSTSLIASLYLNNPSAVNQIITYFCEFFTVCKLLPDGSIQLFQ